MTDEELDQLEHEERLMVENNPSTGSGHRQGQFDPAQFDSATASIEIVWNWLCQRVPGLRESPGLGVPPNDKAGPLTYGEGHLYFLLGKATGRTSVWSFTSLSRSGPVEECHIVVEMDAGYGYENMVGHGEATCAWGEPGRQPAKEARLRAAADMLLKAGTERTP